MFLHIIEAKYIKDYQIWLKFNDEKSGKIDLSSELWGEIFEPLKNQNFFKNFRIENDTIAWENGADIAPESLYQLMEEQNKQSAK